MAIASAPSTIRPRIGSHQSPSGLFSPPASGSYRPRPPSIAVDQLSLTSRRATRQQSTWGLRGALDGKGMVLGIFFIDVAHLHVCRIISPGQERLHARISVDHHALGRFSIDAKIKILGTADSEYWYCPDLRRFLPDIPQGSMIRQFRGNDGTRKSLAARLQLLT